MTTVGAVPARPVLALLRRRRRSHRRPQQRSDRFIAAYTACLYAAIGGWLGFQTLRQRPTGPATAAGLVAGLARFGPALLLLGLTAVLRYATWQGPVLFSAPDVGWLLAAPLDHAELVRPRLVRGLALGAGTGALIGLAAFVVLEAELGVPAGPLLVAAVLGLALAGLLAVALGWLVESSAVRARAVLRASPVGMLLAAAAALVPAGTGLGRAMLWSGPWGWAVGPVVAAAGGSAPGWQLQLVLLALAAAAALAAALASAGGAPVEELARRAGLRSGLSAGLYAADARSAALLRRQSGQALLGVRRVRLPRPRSRWLAIPWRDGLGLGRAPGRLGWALVLSGGGVWAVATAPGRRAVLAVAVVAGYLAASQLIEPLRLEADQPDAQRVLPWRWGDLLLLHCALPALALAALGLAAVGAAALAGLVPAAATPTALAGCLPVAAVLVLSAAIAGSRGRTPVELLAAGDAGTVAVLLWLATGPLLAGVALAVPALTVRRAAEAGTPAATAASNAAPLLLLSVAAGIGYLRSRRPPA